MQLLTIIATTVLALAPMGTQAWAQDAEGNWIANNSWYTIREINVHEACTNMGDDSTILRDVGCRYWVDGAGTIFHGTCRLGGDIVGCN